MMCAAGTCCGNPIICCYFPPPVSGYVFSYIFSKRVDVLQCCTVLYCTVGRSTCTHTLTYDKRCIFLHWPVCACSECFWVCFVLGLFLVCVHWQRRWHKSRYGSSSALRPPPRGVVLCVRFGLIWMLMAARRTRKIKTRKPGLIGCWVKCDSLLLRVRTSIIHT